MMGTLAIVAPRLITNDSPGGSIPWGTVGFVLLIAAGIATCVVLYRRARDRSSDADRAVRRMSKLLGLDDRERSALHALSSAAELHASALLVSKRAFERALDAADAAARPPKPAVVRSLAQKAHPGVR